MKLLLAFQDNFLRRRSLLERLGEELIRKLIFAGLLGHERPSNPKEGHLRPNPVLVKVSKYFIGVGLLVDECDPDLERESHRREIDGECALGDGLFFIIMALGDMYTTLTRRSSFLNLGSWLQARPHRSISSTAADEDDGFSSRAQLM